MLRRTGSRKKIGGTSTTDASPGASSKENDTAGGVGGVVVKSKGTRTSSSSAEPSKRGVGRHSSSGGRLLGAGRKSSSSGAAAGTDGAGSPSDGQRVVSRRHSSDLMKMAASGSGEGGGAGGDATDTAVEYREVMVNGKKKMVRVKKKSAAEVAADGGADGGGHRKLVKVKVVKKPKEPHHSSSNANSGAATVDSSGKPSELNVPIKVGIPANHQLRRPQAPTRSPSSDNASGVWSKAARSLFSFHEKRSKTSSGEDDCVDLAFQPEGGASDNDKEHLNKSGHSRGSRSRTSSYKPPTQLNGEPGFETKNKPKESPSIPLKPSAAAPPSSPPPQKPLKSEFFEKFAAAEQEDFDGDAPPVLEINTNANMTRTKTKSLFQSESMLRRQFIQDQWLSGGSNYLIWEQAAQKKLTDSQHTPATDYMSAGSASTSMGGGSEFADDVSDITCEDLTPPVLVEDFKKINNKNIRYKNKRNKNKDQDDDEDDDPFNILTQDLQHQQQLDEWDALCSHRINRFGARSASTAEAFINRGMAQLRANKLDEAADSLLSAVCFLEEVHGTMESYNNRQASDSPAHMHMAQAFFLLGKVYMQQEQYPMAESALFKALNIRQLHLGKSHPDTVQCWEQLGLSYVQRALQHQQQHSPMSAAKAASIQRQAVEILTQVLKLKRAIFGSLHVSVAHTARVVAQLCAMQNQPERAQRLYKQVLNVLNQFDQQETAVCNPDFPDPKDVILQKQRKQELADIEAEMKKFGLSEEVLEI